MRQPIANILLQHDDHGSNVQLKNVTPAEVMFLTAMHRVNCGKDPIIELKEVPEDAFEKDKDILVAQIAKLEQDYEKVENDQLILEDIRASRLGVIEKRIEAKKNTLQGLEQIESIRNLDPANEFRRLCFKYNQRTLREFYPGRIPSLPQDFKEARENGLNTTVESEKWIVGGEKLVKANG